MERQEKKRRREEEKAARLLARKQTGVAGSVTGDCGSFQDDETSRKNSLEDSQDEPEVDVVGDEGLDLRSPMRDSLDGYSQGLPGALDDMEKCTRLEEWGYETSTRTPHLTDYSAATNTTADTITPCQPSSNFSIASLLERPKVARGRRPNSKYPRLQACKSFVGVAPTAGVKFPQPLYPITQPVGFQVERLSSPSPTSGLDNALDEPEDRDSPMLSLSSQ